MYTLDKSSKLVRNGNYQACEYQFYYFRIWYLDVQITSSRYIERIGRYTTGSADLDKIM